MDASLPTGQPGGTRSFPDQQSEGRPGGLERAADVVHRQLLAAEYREEQRDRERSHRNPLRSFARAARCASRAWVSASRQQRCRLADRYPRRGPARLTAAGQSRPATHGAGRPARPSDRAGRGPHCRRRGTMSWSWLTMPSAAVVSGLCSKIPPRTICASADHGPEPARWRFDQRRPGRAWRRTRQHGDHRLHPAIIGCTMAAATAVTAASSAKPPAPGWPRTDCDDAPGAPRRRGSGPDILAGITVIFAVAARITLVLVSPVLSSPWGMS
jgi:hypothetical protein